MARQCSHDEVQCILNPHVISFYLGKLPHRQFHVFFWVKREKGVGVEQTPRLSQDANAVERIIGTAEAVRPKT